MNELVEKIRPLIIDTITGLNGTKFKVDPIAGPAFSRITSVTSSAYKRHGNILEAAILERVRQIDRFEVRRIESFYYTSLASSIVNAAIADPSSLDETHLPYQENAALDRLQLDIVVFDKETRIVSAYEVKRGNGAHDSGKKRSMKREALLAKVLLKSYGEQAGWTPVGSASHVIFYYGIREFPAPLGIIGSELDAHFGEAMYEDIEAVNECFRASLYKILA